MAVALFTLFRTKGPFNFSVLVLTEFASSRCAHIKNLHYVPAVLIKDFIFPLGFALTDKIVAKCHDAL